MTVCIAAICENGRSIIVAADRMFTNPGLSLEFETEEQKIEELGNYCVALSAGNSVFATEILDTVRYQLGGNKTPPFDRLIGMVKSAYSTIRAEKAHEIIATTILGADFAKYQAAGCPMPTYLEKQPQVYQQITMMQNQFNLGVDFIIAGIDKSGAHICQVMNPGTLAPLHKLGYATIGSGAMHALIRLSLWGQTTHRNILETLADVFTAKKLSEVAPGVGNATDIAIIDEEKGTWHCGKSVMDELEAVHSSTTARMSPDLENLGRKYNEEHPKS